jgi:hypothetical protein
VPSFVFSGSNYPISIDIDSVGDATTISGVSIDNDLRGLEPSIDTNQLSLSDEERGDSFSSVVLSTSSDTDESDPSVDLAQDDQFINFFL